MMSLPFFGVALALLLAAFRQPQAAVVVTLAAVVGTLVLFSFHATDVLPLDF
ncbi:DUF5993 family protein [Acuticoccus sp. MNP-M23]|uniref:DUF5993 family protein n=1 Tax=Acuticoccus sp. MNP-M23 TaxID=3072793 RepID=UPI0028160A57|nr:DUF5993 family protein [Acuticoccus sp. MNP-M23]WMS41008.1 DUF5993 family protein [Acuticoccus sp. MNP-M23]